MNPMRKDTRNISFFYSPKTALAVIIALVLPTAISAAFQTPNSPAFPYVSSKLVSSKSSFIATCGQLKLIDSTVDARVAAKRRCSKEWRACGKQQEHAPLLAFERLEEWLVERGGEVHGVAVRDSKGGGREMIATTSIAAGERPVFVPASCYLGYGYATTDTTAAEVKATVQRVPSKVWALQLAVALLREELLEEHGGGSGFSAYLATLPRAYGGLPMMLDKADTGAVQVRCVAETLQRRRQYLAFFADTELADLAQSIGVACGGAAVDEHQLAWALSTCQSRAFRVKEHDERNVEEPTEGGHLSALVPFVDMCNHAARPNARVCSSERGTWLLTTRDVEAGAALEVQYGPQLPNESLFLGYGFTLQRNEHDSLRFSVNDLRSALTAARSRSPAAFADPGAGADSREEDRAQAAGRQEDMLAYMAVEARGREQQAWLEKGAGRGKARRGELVALLDEDGRFDRVGWALARVVSADALDLVDVLCSGGGPFAGEVEGSAASARLERRAGLVLREACERALGELPTSVADDEGELEALLRWEQEAAARGGGGEASEEEQGGRTREARESLIAAVRFRLQYKALATRGRDRALRVEMKEGGDGARGEEDAGTGSRQQMQ